jgi:hypothetical protein
MTATPSITNLSAASRATIIHECEAALTAVASKLGLTLERKSFSYTPDGMPVPFRLGLAVTADDGSVMDPREVEWRKWAVMLGFQPDDFGRSFTSGRRSFRICGCKPRGQKYTVLGEGPQGGTYKFQASAVKAGLS